MGDFGLGFLNPVGEVVVVSLGAGAEVVGFLFSVTGAFDLEAAVAVVAVDGLREDRLLFGTGALACSLGAVVLGGALAGAGDFAVEATGAAFGVVGVLGNLARLGDLGSGLLDELAIVAGVLTVDIVGGFLVATFPFVPGVPLTFALEGALPAFGVFGAVAVIDGRTSVGGGRASPPETAVSSVGSAGFSDASSCTPVTVLSGLSPGTSVEEDAASSSTTFAGAGSGLAGAWTAASSTLGFDSAVSGSGKSDPFIMLPRFGIASGASRIGGGALEDSRVSTACSGTASGTASLFFRASFSSLTTLFSSAVTSSPSS